MKPINEIYLKDGVSYKKCNLCGEDKSIYEFFKCSAVKSGIRGDCKKCCSTNQTHRYVYIAEREKYRKLKQIYGLEKEDYLKMHKEQGGRCFICGVSEKDLPRALHVDHNHTTGNVRGLLCGVCNKGLGSLRDSVNLLERAIYYLKIKDGNAK